jgi:hypothetical protein
MRWFKKRTSNASATIAAGVCLLFITGVMGDSSL